MEKPSAFQRTDDRRQKTDEFAALCAEWDGKIEHVPEDRVQRTDDRGQKTEKPSARFFVLTRREAPKLICLLSSQTSVL
jgi:hypothetical protein